MKLRVCVSILAALTGLGLSARADAPQVDPAAREMLSAMTLAYQRLHSFSARVKIEAGSGASLNSSLSTVVYEKPNLAFVYTKSPSGEFKTVLDGKTIYVTKPSDAKEYEEMPVGSDTAAIALAIRTGGASVIGLFPFAVSGNDPFALIGGHLKSLTTANPDTVNGERVDVVDAVESAPGLKDATMTIAIGQDDHLLRRVGFVSGDGHAIVETFSDVKVDPKLSPAEFRFTPPAGAKPIPLTPGQS